MGWKRIGNHSYLYRSRRDAGRVVSEYVGRGETATLIGTIDQIERQERDEQRADEKAEHVAAEREERAFREWFETVEAVATGAMLTAGFHKHHGQWRRTRMADANDTSTATAPAAAAEPPAKMTWDELNALSKRAEKGDRSCLPQLRKALKSGDYPNWSRRIRDTLGNPADWLETSLAGLGGGKNDLAMIEASKIKMDQLRKELEGPDPTPMERLLAERAVFCWFAVNTYEALYTLQKDQTIRQAEYQVRRIDSAHKRFLSAVATLARVRKLALPTLQVNIGANQVNVAQSGG